MKKRIYTAVLAGVLVLSQAASVFARPVHVTLDGFLIEMSQPAVLIDGQAMITAADAAAIIGNLVSNNQVPDAGEMISVRDVANAASLNVSWNADAGLVQLSSGGAEFSLLSRMIAQSNHAALTMSFQEALSRINSRDARLIAMEENTIILERELREINEYLRDNNIRGTARRRYTVLEVQRLRQREGLRNQERALVINEQMIREGNEMQLRSALADVARAELDIILLQQQLSVEERGVAITELLSRLGMESDAAVRDARAAVDRTQTNLESLRISLTGNRQTLNSLLGLPAATMVDVVDVAWPINRPAIAPHISNMRENAPNVALLQIDLDFAEYVFFSYDVLLMRSEQESDYRYRGRRQEPSIVIEMRNDIAAAQRGIDNAGNTLENRIRAVGNDIEALMEQMAIAQSDLDAAIVSYQETALRYVTGMATWLELERARLVILNHEVALARHEINQRMLTQMFLRPYFN